ncbi:YpiB family protein [Mechercharimyces sp. CAU 1602]|uniref:YpiB family protein n=1 Tax=Mechercharimyces sp. CAU 1602 TaxID=2973933 RepID=UPI002161A181|nr:YpiB family protein [Mechercharimyces sp. CAU 1602]MCS1350999.1 YpiB family protein [Mechercharimyces sp. CAU 1602]
MQGRITSFEKKEFIYWFLNKFELQRREAAWLLTYVASNATLLDHVHFVDNTESLSKSICIASRCSNNRPFIFTKNRRTSDDVETAFYDLRAYSEEELYICLSFKGNSISPEYAAVLEANPMDRQNLTQNYAFSLLAEIILDEVSKEYRKRTLYDEIDRALAERNKEKFLQLSEEWRLLLET